jgi:hypothetical protein
VIDGNIVVVARVNVRVCESPKPGAASALITRLADIRGDKSGRNLIECRARGRDERIVETAILVGDVRNVCVRMCAQ